MKAIKNNENKWEFHQLEVIEGEHPELEGELNYYNNSGDFKNNYNLSYEGDRYYYRKKKSQTKKETPQHRNGGSIIELISETTISLVDPLNVPEFQNGGSINVIPDGALHARKHNMNLDGITEKGIPVVSEKDNGKIEQQAEIEKEEVNMVQRDAIITKTNTT